MATEILVNFGSGNVLLPGGTKPLPEPMLTYHELVSCNGIQLSKGSQEIPQSSIVKFSLKISCLKSEFNYPGANESIYGS